MNSRRNKLKRLLRLFPAKYLKEKFNVDGNLNDMAEAISGMVDFNLNIFLMESHFLTKQHIYIYDFITGDYDPVSYRHFPLEIFHRDVIEDTHFIWCLPTTVVRTYLSDPPEKVDVEFYQPVLIRIKDDKMVISYTKLEPDIRSYFPANKEARRVIDFLTESETLLQIIHFFAQSEQLLVFTDLNPGIKRLWDDNVLDCHRLLFLDTFSVATQTMNEEHTFKEMYPERYAQVVKNPIGKSIWKYLLDDNLFCKKFTAEPNFGRINITSYPDDANQVDYVIGQILQNNQ